MQVDQLYFSDFEIAQMQIKEIKSYANQNIEVEKEGIVNQMQELFGGTKKVEKHESEGL